MYYFRESIPGAALLEKAVQFVFPMSTYCICCSKYIDGTREYALCDHCVRHIRWGNVEIDLEREAEELHRPRSLDSARACMNYGPYERQMIFELKYNKKTYVSRILGKILYDRIMNDPEGSSVLTACDIIVPVPISRERMAERGFNQTARVGRHLSRAMGIPMGENCLLRIRNTRAQKSVTGLDRYANMKSAVAINPKCSEMIRGKSILLLDDVYTTGATAAVCGEALRKAEAREIHLLALASGNDFASGYFE